MKMDGQVNKIYEPRPKWSTQSLNHNFIAITSYWLTDTYRGDLIGADETTNQNIFVAPYHNIKQQLIVGM